MRVQKVFRRMLVFAIVLAVGLLVGTSAPAVAQEGCNATPWDLTAGQTINVGTVTVSSDETNIYVSYTLTYQNPNCPDSPVDATFGTLHVWIGNDLTLVPANPQGTPVPGQFCQAATGKCFDASGLTTYTFVYPIADLELAGYNFCGSPLYVVTHAEVNIDSACDASYAQHETAFGGPDSGDGPRWWFNGQFTPDCTNCGGGGNPTCETAYGKGNYVWTTDRRSNPEELPSLSLTRNRWGWATKLCETGETTSDIWAGAGLNNTNKGTQVGDLTLNWNGTEVQVCYDMKGASTLDEVHIYAGDDAPTTIAPGQYGFINSGDPLTNPYCATLPATDTNDDGCIWVVAHGVACHE